MKMFIWFNLNILKFLYLVFKIILFIIRLVEVLISVYIFFSMVVYERGIKNLVVGMWIDFV